MSRRPRGGVSHRLGAVALAACAASVHCGPPQPAADAGTVPACATRDAAGGQTLTFVISSMEIDSDDDPHNPHTGFDIDGFASTEVDQQGCTHADFLSTLDPDLNCRSVLNELCNRGAVCPTRALGCTLDEIGCQGTVDNQLPTLASTATAGAAIDLRAALREAVEGSRIVTLVEVSGVDDVANDLAVRVRMYRGFASARPPCGPIQAGARYRINAGTTASNGEAVPLLDMTGDIVGGRVRASAGDSQSFTIAIPAGPEPFLLESRRVHVGFDIQGDEIRNGNFGGWVPAQRIIDWISALFDPRDQSLAYAVTSGLVDFQLHGICYDTVEHPRQYGGVSIGLGFRGVRADVDPTQPLANAPTPGTCSDPIVNTPPPDAGADAGADPEDAPLDSPSPDVPLDAQDAALDVASMDVTDATSSTDASKSD